MADPAQRGCAGRPRLRSPLTSRAPVCRAVVVALPARPDPRAAARARAARAARRPASSIAVGPSAAERCIRGRTASIDRERLGVGDPRQPPPRVDARPPSSPRPSRCSRSRRRCAGRAARRRSPASGRRRAAARRKRVSVELLGEHVGAERREPLVEARAALGHQLEHRAVELDHLVPARAQHEPRPARRAPPAPAVAVDAPRAGHRAGASAAPGRPRSAGTGACRACRPRSPRGRRGARASGRSAWRGCGVRISSGTRPSSTGRIRLAAYAIVSPSGIGLRRRSGGQRQPPRALLEAERDQRGAQRRAHRRLAVDLLERQPLDRAGAHLLDQRLQRRLQPRVVGRRQASASARPPRSR